MRSKKTGSGDVERARAPTLARKGVGGEIIASWWLRTLGLAADTTERSVDFPAFGTPTIPTSATS